LKSRIVLLVKIVVASGLLYYLLQSGKIDLGRLVDRLNDPRVWGWVALAQALVLAMLFFAAIRWNLLLRAQGIVYSFREVFSLGMIGFFFNQFVPGSTGGDLVKAYYVAVEHSELRAAGVTTVFLDRVIGLFVLIAMAGCAVFFNVEWIRADAHLEFLAMFITCALLGFLFASLLFFNETFRKLTWMRSLVRRWFFYDKIHKIQSALFVYRKHPGKVFAAVLLSVLVQSSVVLSCFCLFLALGGGVVSLESFFFLVPVALLVMAIPVSPPGGLGVGEWVFTELFRKVGYVDGGLIALVQRANWYLWALVGLLYFLRKKKRVSEALAKVRDVQKRGESSEAPVDEKLEEDVAWESSLRSEGRKHEFEHL